jgi:outer membrane autotransporter protein
MGSSPGPNTVYLYADEALGYASSDPQHPAFLALKAPQAPQRTWRIWSEAYGGGASISGALPLGTAPLTFAGGGGAFGADYLANPDTIVGFAVGGGTSGFDVADRLTSGQVNSAHFAAYAAERWGPLYATGILGYNAFYNTEKRSVSIPGSTLPIIPVPGLANNLQDSFASQSVSGRVEVGWRFPVDKLTVTPFGALQFDVWDMQGSTEGGVNGGANNLGLSYASRVVSSLPLFLGAQVDSTDLMVFGNQASAWFRLAWEHEFEDSRTIQASFISAPGFDFIVAGATVPSDAARMDLGGKIWLTHNLSMLGNFSGAFSPGGNSYGGTAGFSYTW